MLALLTVHTHPLFPARNGGKLFASSSSGKIFDCSAGQGRAGLLVTTLKLVENVGFQLKESGRSEVVRWGGLDMDLLLIDNYAVTDNLQPC